jgi:hypothetical protein
MGGQRIGYVSSESIGIASYFSGGSAAPERSQRRPYPPSFKNGIDICSSRARMRCRRPSWRWRSTGSQLVTSFASLRARVSERPA